MPPVNHAADLLGVALNWKRKICFVLFSLAACLYCAIEENAGDPLLRVKFCLAH